MLQLIVGVAIGVAIGWIGERLMRTTMPTTRTHLVAGVLGALGALSAARWAGMTDVHRPAQTVTLALLGALSASFVAGLVRQHDERLSGADGAPSA